eukprot:363325-Chlamydomonas_euryale.AAC.2
MERPPGMNARSKQQGAAYLRGPGSKHHTLGAGAARGPEGQGGRVNMMRVSACICFRQAVQRESNAGQAVPAPPALRGPPVRPQPAASAMRTWRLIECRGLMERCAGHHAAWLWLSAGRIQGGGEAHRPAWVCWHALGPKVE